MRITLAQLEAFRWIAELGSFQEAARQLNLACPTVSLRIRDLERALGVPLFHRVERPVTLTHEGQSLNELVPGLLGVVQQIHERVGSAETVHGVFRLGIPETFALACLPELLRILERDHPAVRLELDIGTSASLSDALEERRIDLAVLGNAGNDLRLRYVPLCKHDMVWTASPQMGIKGPVRPVDLRGLPIISNGPPAPQHRMIMDWFRHGGSEPLRMSTCTSVTVICNLVSAGVAISLLPLPIISSRVSAGELVVLPAKPMPQPSILHVCYRAAEGGVGLNAIIRAITQSVACAELFDPL